MGYIYLIIALLAGTTKGYCGKMTSGYIAEYKDAMLANTLRMSFCIIIGLVMVVIQNGTDALKIDRITLAITALSGITSSVFVVTWLVSVKKGAYMMMDVFTMLGMIVPLIGSRIMFGEAITLVQWTGLAVLLLAALIMCSYSSSIKGSMNITAIILLVICGASNGLTDFSQKLFVEYSSGVSIAAFNFYTYVFSALVLVICYGVLSAQDKGKGKPADLKHIAIYLIIMAVCLFANSFFQTKAAQYLPSGRLYPLSKGASLILASLMSAILFKERLTVKAIIGIVLSFGALLIINL